MPDPTVVKNTASLQPNYPPQAPAHYNQASRQAAIILGQELPASTSTKRSLPEHNGTYPSAPKRRQAYWERPMNDSRCDEYNLVKVLDRGSFGIVTLVCHKDDSAKTYARKQLSLAKVATNAIRQEVDLIRKAHHRHVVNVVEEYADENWYYIVMDPAARGDLEKYLRDMIRQPREAWEWEEFGARRFRLLQWMYCLAITVQHIHELDIRHRDIKPPNILVHDENILLTDFGTSFHSEEDTRYTYTSTRGTTKYLPPEAAENRRFGRSGDIFSLGCVFWEMAQALSGPVLTHQFPSIIEAYSLSANDPGFLNEMRKIKEHSGLKKRLPERSRFSECFLDMLLGLIRNMLSPEPSHRYTADQVVESLGVILKEARSIALPCCDVTLDESNHPAMTSAATTASTWPTSVMALPLMADPFSLDPNGPAFLDLMNGAPVSPQPPVQKSLGDANSPTPSPSLSSLSPWVMSGLTPQNLDHALSLGAGPETPASMNGSNHGTSPAPTITDSTRKAILDALSSAANQAFPFGGPKYSFNGGALSLSPQGQPVANSAGDPHVPSTLNLQRYVGAYLHYFHPHLPFLHIPTLSFGAPSQATNGRPQPGRSGCLILSMAAIGALYETDHDESMNLFRLAKKMIQLFLDERRKAMARNSLRTPATDKNAQKREKSADTPLWLVQAMLLNVVYGHISADRVVGQIASTHCAALVSLAHGAELLRPRRVDAEDQGMAMHGVDGAWADYTKLNSREQVQWLRWKTAEEQKRTLYAIFVVSSLLVLAYNHIPTLNNSEILLDLPCDEEFFTAPSSAAFYAKGGIEAANHNQMTFRDALEYLLRTNEKQQELAVNSSRQPFRSTVNLSDMPKSELKPSTFGCLILINALHNYIWETQQRYYNEVWTNEKTEKMHRHIEPALEAWQAAWASNPHHSLHRPNPFGMGPLSADAIPLLDLAYIRLYVNLSRSKEMFWQRDWKGLAEELSRGSKTNQHAERSPDSNAESSTTDPSDNSGISSVFINSPPTQSSSPKPNPPAPAPNGVQLSQLQESSWSTSRREKRLRKAAFYAADSLFMAAKLGISFADSTSWGLPLQSAICAFDCAQVLAEWVATLQDRVGRYLGILGQDDVGLTQAVATVLLEDEDVRLLGKVEEILVDTEQKMNIDLMEGISGMGTRLRTGDNVGYAAKILRITAYLLGKATVWPVKRLMADCLEYHANYALARAEKSVLVRES